MEDTFLESYAEAFTQIPGGFSLDAYALMMLTHQLALAPRDVLEIGAYQGLSAIGLAALRGPDRRFFVVDAYREQISNRSGSEIRDLFWKHMHEFHGQLGFVTLYENDSNELYLDDFQGEFSLCYIDGDHSVQTVRREIELCHALLNTGGLLVLDDYFNAHAPGVAQALNQYFFEQPGSFCCVASGFGHVILQKLPAPISLDAALAESFPKLPRNSVTMWGSGVPLFSPGLATLFDLRRSTPQELVFNPLPKVSATIQVSERHIKAERGNKVSVGVQVSNHTNFPFPWGDKSHIQLSYHLRDRKGALLSYDNPRSGLKSTLYPDETLTTPLVIYAPTQPGTYSIEVDLVWEGIIWFKEGGNHTASFALEVS